MAKGSSQKFIARNRAPRVQIEYETELYGAQKAVQVPFVMGVLADLAGKPSEAQESLAKRKALEIDAENFNDRLKAMKPRAAFPVKNVLTEEGGNLSVDLSFESMEDFSPAAVASRVKGLDTLLQARTQLENLKSYMDGKDDAVKLLQQAIKDPALLQALGSAANPAAEAAGEGAGDADAGDGGGEAPSE